MSVPSLLPDASQQLVSELVERMKDFAEVEAMPIPSILLALNLVRDTWDYAHKWLLQWIKEVAVTRAQKGMEGRGLPPQRDTTVLSSSWPLTHPRCSLVPTDMTSGEVALYVLSLLSSCQDPRHVRAFGETINLVQVLQQKTDEEVAKLGTRDGSEVLGCPGWCPPPCSPLSSPHLTLQWGMGCPKPPCTVSAWTPWPCAWPGQVATK